MTNVARFPLEKTRQPGETREGHQARKTLEAALKLHKWDAPLLHELAIGQMGIMDLCECTDPVIIAAIAELDAALEKLEKLDQENGNG